MSYIYRVSVANKNNPGTIVGETNVVINDPCGTITTLNQQQTRILSEVSASIDQQLKVFPNPSEGFADSKFNKGEQRQGYSSDQY